MGDSGWGINWKSGGKPPHSKSDLAMMVEGEEMGKKKGGAQGAPPGDEGSD